eukprot:gene20126-biopygen23537
MTFPNLFPSFPRARPPPGQPFWRTAGFPGGPSGRRRRPSRARWGQSSAPQRWEKHFRRPTRHRPRRTGRVAAKPMWEITAHRDPRGTRAGPGRDGETRARPSRDPGRPGRDPAGTWGLPWSAPPSHELCPHGPAGRRPTVAAGHRPAPPAYQRRCLRAGGAGGGLAELCLPWAGSRGRWAGSPAGPPLQTPARATAPAYRWRAGVLRATGDL